MRYCVRLDAFRLLAGYTELIDDLPGLKVLTPFCRNRVNAFAWREARKISGKLYTVNVTRLDDVDIGELIVRLSPISMDGTIISSRRAETHHP